MILDIFSSDQGIKSYIISGVRSTRSKSKTTIINVLNLVRYEAYEKGGNKLSRIKEIEYNYVYKSLPFEVVKGSLAIFLIEICRKAIKASDQYEDIYNYVVKGLIHLDNVQGGLGHFHIDFLIGLSSKLGFGFNNNYDERHTLFDLSDGVFRSEVSDHRYVLNKQLSYELHQYLSKVEPAQVSRDMRLQVLKAIIRYFQYHIAGFGELKSLPILLSLYE